MPDTVLDPQDLSVTKVSEFQKLPCWGLVKADQTKDNKQIPILVRMR